MDTERVQATASPEAWAAAQVEEVARELARKPKRSKRTPPPKVRGVFFRANPKGEAKDHMGRMGDWWVCWFDGDSRKHREKVGARADALALYQRRKTEVRQLRHFPESMRRSQKASLKAVCDDYAENLKVNGRDPRAQAKTRLAEVVDILGGIAAKNVTPQDIERLKVRLSETPARGRKNEEGEERSRTPASVNRYLQDLRAAYNLARRNGKVEKNPVADVRLLRENNKRVREMTPDEERAILAVLEPSQRRFHTDLRPIVRFLTATGLRLDEACNLRWSDVDWSAGVATLRKTKAQKTQHIPLSAEAAAILRALGPAGGDALLFCWPDGRAWTPGYVTHAFTKAVQKAGVTDLHVHDTRHTFACRLLRAGVDIYTVSKLLRHASVVMSERYALQSQADLKVAV